MKRVKKVLGIESPSKALHVKALGLVNAWTGEPLCWCGRDINNDGVCSNGHAQPYREFCKIGDGLKKSTIFERFVQKLIHIGKYFGWLRTKNLDDGYHTIDELYFHRMVLFSVICYDNAEYAWKSTKHHDGTMFDGMFIVGVKTKLGQYTYHYNMEFWDHFDVEELEFAPEYDGHRPSDIGRLHHIGIDLCNICEYRGMNSICWDCQDHEKWRKKDD